MTDASEADLQRAWRAEYRETWRYTQVEFVKITRSFVAKQPIVGARWLEFRGILQSLAWFYVVGKAEDVDPLLKPGELKRHLESHRKKLRKAQRSVAAIMGNHYLAHEIRKAGSVAIDRDLRKLHGELEYFCHVLDKAEIESGEKDSKGGNRPDETLHEFVRGLYGIYLKIAAAPKQPNSWIAAGATESPGKPPGEFLAFLAACLYPLEKIERSPTSLFQLHRRALAIACVP